jgi:integrase
MWGDHGKIVRLLILLGSRRQEVGGMRWTELDLDAGKTWALPAARSKNNRAHTIALPPAALDIIRSVPRRTQDALFGDRSPAGFSDWSHAKERLDQPLAGAVKPWRLHDIRRSVATGMADIGVEPHHIEAVLNHHSGHRAGIHGIYNRSSYTNEVARALARWSEHVTALIEGRKSRIVAMPQRA